MDVFRAAAAAVGGVLGDRHVGQSDMADHTADRERAGTHDAASASASAAASRTASGATSPVLYHPVGSGAGSGGALELQDAVDLIAELTSALHESEAERRELADRHDAERRMRKTLEAQVTVSVAQMLPLGKAPAAHALDGLIEFGVNGMNAGARTLCCMVGWTDLGSMREFLCRGFGGGLWRGSVRRTAGADATVSRWAAGPAGVNTVTSGVNSMATGVTGVMTGAAAAFGASMNNPGGFPSLLNPGAGRRFRGGGTKSAKSPEHTNGGGGTGADTSPGSSSGGGGGDYLSPTVSQAMLRRENRQQWTKLPEQIEARSVQPSRAADSSYSAEKAVPADWERRGAAAPGDGGGVGAGGGGRAAASGHALTMPRYEWDLGGTSEEKAQHGGGSGRGGSGFGGGGGGNGASGGRL